MRTYAKPVTFFEIQKRAHEKRMRTYVMRTYGMRTYGVQPLQL